MKNLFGAGATAFLTCLDMAVKSEVEKWPDEEEKPFADSKKIVLRKVHNKGMCMSLLKEYPQFVKYTSLVMAAILTVWDILCPPHQCCVFFIIQCNAVLLRRNRPVFVLKLMRCYVLDHFTHFLS